MLPKKLPKSLKPRLAFLLLPSLGIAPLDLTTALQTALEKNPSISAAALKALSEHEAIRAQYSPEDPMIGFDYEKNFNDLQLRDGPMRMGSMSQNLRFPLKYFKMASIQSSRADQADTELSSQKLQVRQKVISAYYHAITLERVLGLLKANLESARKTSRTAESRHATGQVPQQDEMKAHVEETRINTEILLTEEEEQSALNELNALLGRDPLSPLTFPRLELKPPIMKVAVSEIPELARKNGRAIRMAEFQVQEAQTRKSLAAMSYLPDFRFSYKRAFGNEMMPEAYGFGVELSIPLWFALKQTAEFSSASSASAQAEHQQDQSLVEIAAKARTLAIKARNHQTLLQIYETALIPQATSTLNSSDSAYRAGKISILELLDSQRSLYQTQIAFYRTFAEFTDVVSELESTAGVSVSNLPLPPNEL